MDRYRKFLVAGAGVALQLLTLLVHALNAGLLPASWVPWVQVVVALATALGVRQVENAPDPSRAVVRIRDAGRSTHGATIGLAVLIATVLAIIGVLSLLSADRADAQGPYCCGRVPSARVPEITSATAGCGDDARTLLTVRVIAPVHPGSSFWDVAAGQDAGVRLQVWDEERFVDVPSTSPVEGTLIAPRRAGSWRPVLVQGGRRVYGPPANSLGGECIVIADVDPAVPGQVPA